LSSVFEVVIEDVILTIFFLSQKVYTKLGSQWSFVIDDIEDSEKNLTKII